MEEFLEQLEEDVLIVGKEGHIQFCNQRLCMKLQYTKEEIEGLTLDQIIESQAVAECLLEEKNLQQHTCCLRDKHQKSILYELQVIEGEWEEQRVYFIMGIESERESYTKRELELMLDQIPFVVSTKSIDGKYAYANKKTEEYYGCTKTEIVGKTDIEIFGQEVGQAFQEVDFELMREQKSRRVESWVKTPKGHMKLLKLDKTPMYNQKREVTGILKIGKQQTLSKLLELDKEQKYEEFLKMIKSEDKWDDLSRLPRVIQVPDQDILRELKAEGLSIWQYDNVCQGLVCNFQTASSKEIVKESGHAEIYEGYITYSSKQGAVDRVYNVEEIDYLVKDKERFLEALRKRGIKYIGVYDITANEEFFGMAIILYKEYDHLECEGESLIKKICKQIGVVFKQYRLSQQLKNELNKRSEVEEELQHFLATATDGMWMANGNGKLLQVSEGLCRMLGRSSEDLKAYGVLESIHPEDREDIEQIKEICYAKPDVIKRFCIRMITATDEIIWLECGVKYIASKKAFMCTSRNITQHKKLEQQKKIYQNKLQLESIKNEFMSNISHEFKTPLNIILSTIQLIEGGIYDPKMKRYIRYIRQNAYRLLRLVNNLIDMTRIESGYYQVELGNYNIVEVVEDMALSAAKYVERKGIRLIFDTEVEECIVACDPEKIERVILNLLSNAIKYTGTNGVIQVDIKLKEGKVILSVGDSGTGIPEQKLEGIFEQFMQVDDSLTRQNEGSGIGLALTKSLVEMHGGRIYAESILGKGTRINVELPDTQIENQKNGKKLQRLEVQFEKCQIEFADIYELH